MDILQYTFFQNALIGALLASILCGFVGTYIVTRRLVFISGGITHASFGGIGIGVFAGINPILSAMVFAILSAFGVQWVSRKKDVRKDSAIAMFWTLGMSVGIICCFLTPGFMPDLPSFLFGSILAISLLTIPQMTANLFTYSYKRMIGASIVIGCIDCIVGLYASYLLNVPSGATIIFVSIILFAAARILAARKH